MSKKPEPSQIAKFRKAARDLETDDSEKALQRKAGQDRPPEASAQEAQERHQ